MRLELNALDGRRFDVVVIGAGVNGASAAQHLAGAGYDVLLVDKGDYGAGTSSRSSRLLHCGLRYFAPGASVWEFARRPSRLRTAMRMARLAMQARRQLVVTAPERTRPLNFHFPIWSDGLYRRWHLKVGLGVLASMAPDDLVPLNHRVLRPSAAKAIPLVGGLRDWDKLEAVAAFTEYQFEWPERLCVDAVMDMVRLGGLARNYTEARRLTRIGSDWEVELADARDASVRPARVRAGVVLNMAGIWIDKVNASTGVEKPRRILGTKGIHVMVQLPPECADNGIVTFNSSNEPLYCIPWRGMHYFGPTETVYEGDPDDIRPTEPEIEGLLAEANILLPRLGVKRKDVLFAWAGVRPLTWDPALPMGKRSRDVHDLAADGMPGVYAMTAGPIMTHRSAGLEMLDIVRRNVRPRRKEQAVDYAARKFPENRNSPPVVDDWTEAKISDLQHAARHEHATSLDDLMFRRVGAGWTQTMGGPAAERAAVAVGDILGWDQARTAAEAAAYREMLRKRHLVAAPFSSSPSQLAGSSFQPLGGSSSPSPLVGEGRGGR